MRPLPLLLFLSLSSIISSVSARQVGERTLLQNSSVLCPLDFNILRFSQAPKPDTVSRCQYVLQGFRLVLSLYLKETNSFLPPHDSAESCWSAHQLAVSEFLPNFDARSSCGFQTSWIAQGCMNISTRAQFESLIPRTDLNDLVSACNRSLQTSACSSCQTIMGTLHMSYLLGAESVGNVSDCRAYMIEYAAAIAHSEGPTDPGTAKCIFALDISTLENLKSKPKRAIIIVLILASTIVFVIIMLIIYWRLRRKKNRTTDERSLEVSEFDLTDGNTMFFKFTFDDIKVATKNFSNDYIIGRGGYGNVYKGVLPDGSEIAVKRFKNISEAGIASFSHEVEVIASVRHVNLVAMRGYCTITTLKEVYERIIVTDLVKNGSLHDHLFGLNGVNLSWPIRQRIALGTAKGLAYLHYGAQPSIIHRDIKASNILVDEKFEAQVADFGLAKFKPDGMSHISTRAAGTLGYVAPEYVLYGQVTQRSDVFSFGVVLLELLSGKKALLALNDGQPILLSDWAWTLVKEGRTLDVVDETMLGLGSAEVMEKHVLIAVLCSHPQLYARPTMDRVVNMLDTDIPVPSMPERPSPVGLIATDIQIY